MKSLRLKNFRCLEDTGEIEFSPLTFLVGKNGSGKSSFLSFFSLLKQNTCVTGLEEMRWKGKFIDFDSIKNVIRHDTNIMEISFSLKNVKIPNRDGLSIYKDVKITLKYFNDKNNNIKLNYIIILIDEKEIKIKLKTNNWECDILKIGDIDSRLVDDDFYMSPLSYYNDFLPSVKFKTYARKENIDYPYSIACIQEINKILGKYIQRIYNFLSDNNEEFLRETKEETRKRLEIYLAVKFTNEDFNKLHDLFYYEEINFIIDSINKHINQLKKNIFINSSFTEGMDRVNEVTFDKKAYNLTSYLYGKFYPICYHNTDGLKELNSMLLKHFNFSIDLDAEVINRSHGKIMIKKDKEIYNLADCGSGYMNMVPLLVSIWNILEDSTSEYKEKFFIIEHPEKYLHPCLQARFVSFLTDIIKQAKNRNKDICFIIETHSQVILNKIGNLIALNEFNTDDTSIYIFDAKTEGMQNDVERSQYTNDGFLVNWPECFFVEDMDE